MGQDLGQVEVDLPEVDLADTVPAGVVDMWADAAGSRAAAVAVWAWDSSYSAAAAAEVVVASWVPCLVVVGGNHRVAGDACVEA